MKFLFVKSNAIRQFTDTLALLFFGRESRCENFRRSLAYRHNLYPTSNQRVADFLTQIPWKIERMALVSPETKTSV